MTDYVKEALGEVVISLTNENIGLRAEKLSLIAELAALKTPPAPAEATAEAPSA